MSEMVERVERVIDAPPRQFIWRRKLDKKGFEVIQDTDPDGPVDDDSQIVVFEGSEYACRDKACELQSRAIAQAAIRALREPTGAMLSAACRVPDTGDALRDLAQQWRAMIDEALSGAPSS